MVLFCILLSSCSTTELEQRLLYFPINEEYPEEWTNNGLYQIPVSNAEPGEQDHFYVFHQRADTEESKGIVLYFRGWMTGLFAADYVANFYREMGYDTVVVDFRGYGQAGYGEFTITEQSILSDARDACEFIITELGYDLSEIIIAGSSFGCYIACLTASSYPVSGVVLFYPFNSLQDMLNMFVAYYSIPISWLVDAHLDVQEVIKGLQMPLLMFLAKEDSVIPASLGEEVYESAISAQKRALFIHPEADHMFVGREEHASWWQEKWELFF